MFSLMNYIVYKYLLLLNNLLLFVVYFHTLLSKSFHIHLSVSSNDGNIVISL